MSLPRPVRSCFRQSRLVLVLAVGAAGDPVPSPPPPLPVPPREGEVLDRQARRPGRACAAGRAAGRLALSPARTAALPSPGLKDVRQRVQRRVDCVRRRAQPGLHVRARASQGGGGGAPSRSRLPAPARQRLRVHEGPRRGRMARRCTSWTAAAAVRETQFGEVAVKDDPTAARMEAAIETLLAEPAGACDGAVAETPPMMFGPTFAGDARSLPHPARHPREGARRARPPARPAQSLQPLLEGGRQGPLHRPARSAHRRLGPDRRPLRPPFPTGSHKVGPAYSILAEKQVEGQCVPGDHTLVFPSTGNFGIGGAWVGPRMGYRSLVVLPEDMSAERFAKIEEYGAEVVATPGSESNVKEIYDKVRELRATPCQPRAEPVRGVRQLPVPFPLHGHGRAGSRAGPGPGLRGLRLRHGLRGHHRGGRGHQAPPSGLRHRGRRARAVPDAVQRRLRRPSHRRHRGQTRHLDPQRLGHRPARRHRRPGLPRGLQLLHQGSELLASEGVDPKVAESWSDVFGISGVCNVLGAIKTARFYGLGPEGRRRSPWPPTASTATRRCCSG
jgi:hypothetical protein